MTGCLLLLAALAVAQDARKSFQLTPDGRWQPVAAYVAPATRPAATADDPRLARIESLLDQRRFAAARAAGIDYLRSEPSSPQYDRGLLLTARALRGTREFIRGFYYCDQLLDEHADSPLFQDALQLQFDLADAYLIGAKDRLLGLRIVGRQDEAIEMLFRIQQRAPGTPVAEKALLRTADYYWASGDFDLASDAYRSYVQAYPRSPLVAQARLREAYANLAQFHGPAFDSTAILNAKTLMNGISADFPELARAENIPAKLELADRQLARKLYLNADLYRRTGKPKAAIQLCRRLLKLYPTAPEAAEATALLAKLDRTAR